MRMEGKTGNKRIVEKKKKETSKIKMLPCSCPRLKGEEDAALPKYRSSITKLNLITANKAVVVSTQ